MTVNLQSIFISSLNSEKKMWSSDEKKKTMFESIRMAGACRSLFRLCHQAPLNAK